jgi:hypothetical protein
MAENPKPGILRRDFPPLAKLVSTWGEAYTKEELALLDGFLEHWFDIPPCESGHEAFVRLDHCDLLSHFGGWRMTTAAPKASLTPIYRGMPNVYVEQSNLGDVTIAPGPAFDAEALTYLQALGARIGMRDLRPFLLWENCD